MELSVNGGMGDLELNVRCEEENVHNEARNGTGQLNLRLGATGKKFADNIPRHAQPSSEHECQVRSVNDRDLSFQSCWQQTGPRHTSRLSPEAIQKAQGTREIRR